MLTLRRLNNIYANITLLNGMTILFPIHLPPNEQHLSPTYWCSLFGRWTISLPTSLSLTGWTIFFQLTCLRMNNMDSNMLIMITLRWLNNIQSNITLYYRWTIFPTNVTIHIFREPYAVWPTCYLRDTWRSSQDAPTDMSASMMDNYIRSFSANSNTSQ